MKNQLSLLLLLLLSVTGCSNLRPVEDHRRLFVLEPVPASMGAAPASEPGIGLGPIDIPDYLRTRGMTWHVSAQEIKTSTTALWGEPLEAGIQRVLAADLHLGAVYRSRWRRDQVAAEIQVSIQRFDVGPDGKAVLAANWRITNPGGGTVWSSTHTQLERPSPTPAEDPAGAVAAGSALLNDLGREMEAAVRATLARSPMPLGL